MFIVVILSLAIVWKLFQKLIRTRLNICYMQSRKGYTRTSIKIDFGHQQPPKGLMFLGINFILMYWFYSPMYSCIHLHSPVYSYIHSHVLYNTIEFATESIEEVSFVSLIFARNFPKSFSYTTCNVIFYCIKVEMSFLIKELSTKHFVNKIHFWHVLIKPNYKLIKILS